jgi:hypothetical protein
MSTLLHTYSAGTNASQSHRGVQNGRHLDWTVLFAAGGTGDRCEGIKGAQADGAGRYLGCLGCFPRRPSSEPVFGTKKPSNPEVLP